MPTKARTTVAKKAAPPLAALLEKDITAVMHNYFLWLKEQTGYEDLDERSVQLAGTQRIVFQKSDMNREDLEQRKAGAAQAIADREARAEERAAKRAQREADAAAKAEAKAARNAAKAAGAEETKATSVSAGKRTTKATPAKAAAKPAPAPARRRRAAAAATPEL